jgi:WD40 repeat protein
LENGVFFPDYTRFCSGSRDSVANVYHLDTGALVCKLTGHQQASLPTSVSPDGKRILTSSKDGTARLWDAHAGREVMSLKGTLGKHCLPLFSPEGQRVLVIEDDQACILPAADWR